jgi:two-component system response regulator PfeR
MTPKLLMIMHDEVMAHALRARFTREGYEVLWCRNGDDGLTQGRGWSPDVILVDLALPGMHGLDVLKWLTDMPTLVQVPAVLLVEHTISPELLDECLLWGAGSCLKKDLISVADVVSHVQAALKRRNGAREEAPAQPPSQNHRPRKTSPRRSAA